MATGQKSTALTDLLYKLIYLSLDKAAQMNNEEWTCIEAKPNENGGKQLQYIFQQIQEKPWLFRCSSLAH